MKIVISETQLEKLLKESNEELKVLFVGDSHSAGKGWTWNYLMDKEHPEWDVKHIVEGGKRTSWMRQELTKELENEKYDLVFILGGGNDVMSKTPIQTPIKNIQEMVDLVNQYGGTPVVLVGFDNETIYDPEKVKPTKYCDKECMIEYKQKRVNYQTQLADSIKNAVIIPKLEGEYSWTNDAIHAGRSGHILMKDHVNNTIGDFNKIHTKKEVDLGLDKENLGKTKKGELIKQLKDTLKQHKSSDMPEGSIFDKIMVLILTLIGIPLTGGPKGKFNLKDKLGFLSGKKEYNFKSGSNNVSPNKLLNDLNSKLNNKNLAKGLVANAKGESGFNILARGDGGSYANKDSENKRRNVGGYCSFGLWQYNICGGLGLSLLKYYGVDPDNASDEEKMEVLEDYDKQVSFMVNHIKEKGVVSEEKSVKEWIKWIVYNIERPSDKAGATKARIKYAEELGYV